MSLKIPDLFEKKTAHDFFYEFLEANSTKRGFSQRSLSAKLGWPVSYLPDLMKKRKAFTIKRAIEFGNYFHLSPIDFEKLIYLAMVDSGQAKSDELLKIKAAKEPLRYVDDKNFELMNVATLMVFTIVGWLKGTATTEVVIEAGLKKGFSAEVIQECLAKLMKLNVIQKEGEKLVPTREYLFTDDRDSSKELTDLNVGINQQFMTLQGKFLEAPFRPCFASSAFVLIERSRFEEIADRMVAFRNWIFEISKNDGRQPLDKDIRLFQFDLNLTSLFKDDEVRELKSASES
jgi:hypothetical protein